MTDQIPTQSEEIEVLFRKLADSVTESIDKWEDVAFIGIRSGGDHVARHVVNLINERCGCDLPLGALDITLYRDDISKRLVYPEVKATEINFSIDNKDIILVDDVLNTGRSVRAAIDHLMDLGRPKRIRLLVLFDRGGRELPFQAEYVGATIDLAADKIIKLNLPDGDDKIGVIISEVHK